VPKKTNLLGLVAIIAAVTAFGLYSQDIYLIQVGTYAGIYSIVAIGLNLLLGTAGQISLGHSAFFAVGAYTSTILLLYTPLPFTFTIFASAIVAGVFGLIIGYIALRLKGHYLAMATLAFGLIVYSLLREIQFLDGGAGHVGIPSLSVFGWDLSDYKASYYFVWAIAAVVYLLTLSLLHSRVGRALKAIREDDIAANAMGVPVASYKIRVFTLSAIYAGVAGAIYASYLGSVIFNSFDAFVSVNFLMMVVLGGLGSIPGAVLGAVILTFLPELGRAWEDYRLTSYGLLLILLVIFLPKGLVDLFAWFNRAEPRSIRPKPDTAGRVVEN